VEVMYWLEFLMDEWCLINYHQLVYGSAFWLCDYSVGA